MKNKFLILTLCVLFSTPVLADRAEFCDSMARMGLKYISDRQDGKFLSNVISDIKSLNTEHDKLSYDVENAAIEMAERAYEYPMYSDKEQQTRIKVKFMNEVYNECLNLKTN